MKLAVTLIVLLGLAATGTSALKCKSCKGKDFSDPGSGGKLIGNAKQCTAEFMGDSFECPSGFDKSCLKVANNVGKADEDVLRGCSNVEPKDECDKTGENAKCYCKGDECNGAGHGWPSAVLLMSALAAALVGARR